MTFVSCFCVVLSIKCLCMRVHACVCVCVLLQQVLRVFVTFGSEPAVPTFGDLLSSTGAFIVCEHRNLQSSSSSAVTQRLFHRVVSNTHVRFKVFTSVSGSRTPVCQTQRHTHVSWWHIFYLSVLTKPLGSKILFLFSGFKNELMVLRIKSKYYLKNKVEPAGAGTWRYLVKSTGSELMLLYGRTCFYPLNFNAVHMDEWTHIKHVKTSDLAESSAFCFTGISSYHGNVIQQRQPPQQPIGLYGEFFTS